MTFSLLIYPVRPVVNRKYVLYLDYRKAFDSVPHNRLIYKLSTAGFHGELLTWLSSFLANRTMRVGVRGSYSTWFHMLSGQWSSAGIGIRPHLVPTVCQ